MKEELYRKVYVKSEADLPKEDGTYICLHKGETKLDIFPYKVNESHWFVEIDWYLQPIEQSESKIAKEILRKVCKYTDIDTMEFDDDITVSEALEAMEKYCQQLQKVEQEDTYANGYVFCGKCGYKLGKDNPDEEDVEQDNGWQKDELGWHIPTAREFNKIESGLRQQEIIKDLTGEKIEDVKTVTSTEYVKESYIINEDGSLTPEQEEEKPTDEDVMIYFAKHCKNTKDMKANYQVFTRGMVLELVKWLRDNPQQFKGK